MLKGIKLSAALPFFAFAISFAVYLLTIEDSVSFWDCGEFIASAAGLQVGHPPGAPLYAMSARVAAALSPDGAHIAMLINAFSALVSALTILFLYKSIVLLFEIASEGLQKRWSSLWSAFAAAMLFAFTDTFWFSAVEAEVYAYSSLFTAVCFWAALKWYLLEDGNLNSRWVILIAYLCGLSYGVHLLNLLIIPAIVYLVVSRKYKLNDWTRWGVIIASSLAVGLILYFFVPIVLWVLSRFELLFVNRFGLAYNSGLLAGVVVIFAAFVALILFAERRRMAWLLTFSTSAALFLLGFGSYTMVIVRGSQSLPMNQNQVDNIFSLKSYLDRDQYGKTPLVYGPYYSAPVRAYAQGDPIYAKVDGRYEIKGHTLNRKYYKSHCTLFPRMYSNNENHISAYKSWGNVAQVDSVVYKIEGKKQFKAPKPSFVQNLAFLGSYQVWWMYFRYFLWNFSGRQNDNLGQGNILNGNWITGFAPLDNLMLGPQNELPDEYKSNKASNKYYLLPLIIGIIGICLQSKRNKDVFITMLLLFFFTGLAIVLYINQSPLQVRERDYSYVGSFYVFAIWIGFGFLRISQWIDKIASARLRTALVLLFAGVPLLVLSQNYDDHNRSGREIARNYAKNYLNSLPQNSLLVVCGDNDTFTLWYAQIAEGIRTDVKVFNSNYLFTTWNPSQLAQATYDNDAFVLNGNKLYQFPDELRTAIVKDSINTSVPLKQFVSQITDANRKMTSPYRADMQLHYATSRQAVLPGLTADDPNNVYFSDGQNIAKDKIVYLDIIANNYPERTISFAQTVPPRAYSMLKQNLSRVGLNFEFRARPDSLMQKTERQAHLDSYDFFVKRFSFDKLKPTIFYDDVSKRLIDSYRVAFMQTAEDLLADSDTLKAQKLLLLCNQNIPADIIPMERRPWKMVDLMYRAKLNSEACSLANKLAVGSLHFLKFVNKLNSFQKKYVYTEKELALQNLENLASVMEEYGERMLVDKIRTEVVNYQ